jgi:hypothetical protein
MTANLIPVLWIAWAAVALITACLYAYRASLTRDEEGQIFLDEAFDHEKAVQTQIVLRVNRLEPWVRVCLTLTVLMTIVVIAYYAWSMTRSLLA